ncbi:hypothetical protein GJAV_G00057550 [Gymnothorax javanicus]|nr:hypothetical protein GJAV_G00057550 [Gymnothorax javanicus]
MVVGSSEWELATGSHHKLALRVGRAQDGCGGGMFLQRQKYLLCLRGPPERSLNGAGLQGEGTKLNSIVSYRASTLPQREAGSAVEHPQHLNHKPVCSLDPGMISKPDCCYPFPGPPSLFLGSLPVFALKTQVLSVQRSQSYSNPSTLSYKTYYFDQKIDHFGFLLNGTFKQRYLVNDQHWHQENGPILFYTGNEGDITWFCNNTGFMWDKAEELGAMLVFAEHRYYGESLPFGQDSYLDAEHLNYLTSEQALADFAVLIKALKKTIPGAQNSPVIAIGGSYGGMLAAWMRMKYPHVVIGALAASAPIWQFPDMVPCGVFYKILTDNFHRSGKGCSESIRASWQAIDNVTSTAEGLEWTSHEFSLCAPLKNKVEVAVFKSWLQETWVNLAMVDYPYEADFLQPLPRWPIQVVCRYLTHPTAPALQLLHGISQAVKVYFNYTGNTQCLNMSQTATKNLGNKGWDYQACTEMVMPMCTDGVQDMFEPQDWDFGAFAEECQALFGVRPRSDWADTVYGGKNIKSHTNIIFSNGGLDPWSGGGVTKSLSGSLISIFMPEAAHHLDLRFNTNYDPQSVLDARALEVKYFKLWIKQAAKH